MNTILAQAKKEWIEFRRDKLSVSLAIILPLLSLLLFGFGIKLESGAIKLVVRDRDNSALSRKYTDAVLSTSIFENIDPVEEEDSNYELDRGLARVSLVIPEGFEKKILRGEKSKYDVLIDGTDISNAQIIYNTIETVNEKIIEKYKKEELPGIEIGNIDPESEILFNPKREEAKFIVPGAYGVLLWVFPSLLAAVCASREKEHKTIERVIACSPRGPGFVLGKALVYFGIGMVIAISMMTLGALLFGVRAEQIPIPLLVTTPIYVGSAVLFGLALGISANSQTTAVQASSTLGFFPCLLLSGFVYPIANIPYPISLVANLVPARYYIELCRNSLVRGADLKTTWSEPLALLAFLVFFLILNWIFAKRMRLAT